MVTNAGQLAEGVDNSCMHMLGWLMPNALLSTRAIRQAELSENNGVMRDKHMYEPA